MGKYLTLWTQNPVAPWPTDPAEALKLNEVFWATMDGLMKKGEVTEFGWFLDGKSGYAIGEGDSAAARSGAHVIPQGARAFRHRACLSTAALEVQGSGGPRQRVVITPPGRGADLPHRDHSRGA